MATQRETETFLGRVQGSTHIIFVLAALSAACSTEKTSAPSEQSTHSLVAAATPAAGGTAQDSLPQVGTPTEVSVPHGAIDLGPQPSMGPPKQDRAPLLFKSGKPVRDPNSPKPKPAGTFVSAAPAAPPTSASTVDVAELHRRSDSFRQQWKEQQHLYDGLSPAEVEVARANLKRSVFGE